MKALYAMIGVLWLCSLLAGEALWNSVAASPITATSAETTAQPSPPGGEVVDGSPMESGDSGEPRLDLLGNEIEDALADYRIDLGGGVYERHSPETAVPRLISPSS